VTAVSKAIALEISALTERRYNSSLLPKQDALRSHWDSSEMTAAITERFADDGDLCASEALSEISMQLLAPYHWGASRDIVLLIDFPPRIKHGAGW
jgi:hypothetical protein